MIDIRQADKNDAQILFDLIMAIAEHHDQVRYVLTSPAELLAAGFGDDRKFAALIAEYEGATAGFLSFTINYSIWLGGDFMRIDDVFVDARYRGKSIGEALMLAARAHCEKLGIAHAKWEMQRNNDGARRFYERLGATHQDKEVFTWDWSNRG